MLEPCLPGYLLNVGQPAQDWNHTIPLSSQRRVSSMQGSASIVKALMTAHDHLKFQGYWRYCLLGTPLPLKVPLGVWKVPAPSTVPSPLILLLGSSISTIVSLAWQTTSVPADNSRTK